MKPFDPQSEYLVLKKYFADRLRALLGESMPEVRLRAVVVASLIGVHPTDEFDSSFGRVRVFDVRVNGVPGVCRYRLVYGTLPDGSPRRAPDGVKFAVFATWIKHFPDR